MVNAVNSRNEHVKASPRAVGLCPNCKGVLIPKCGKLRVWHWSHKITQDCEPWSEPETEWHLKWKNNVSDERREKMFADGVSKHRADAVGVDGNVIEFQHSTIDSSEILLRTEFYSAFVKPMIWVVDALDFRDRLAYRQGLNESDEWGKQFIKYRFQQPRRCWEGLAEFMDGRCELWFDTRQGSRKGGSMLRIHRIYRENEWIEKTDWTEEGWHESTFIEASPYYRHEFESLYFSEKGIK